MIFFKKIINFPYICVLYNIIINGEQIILGLKFLLFSALRIFANPAEQNRHNRIELKFFNNVFMQ